MKKIISPWLLLAIIPLIFFSCEDDDSEVIASSETIALLSKPSSVLEGESAPFSVIFLGLPEDQTTDITVNYTVSGSNDGTLNGSVTIPAGEQSASFSVAIPEDNDLESEETSLLLTLTDASGGFAINENTPQNSHEFTLEEDIKNISVSNDTLSIAENFSANGDMLQLPISITNPLDAPVTINYTITGSAVAGIDYELLSDNPLVLPAGVGDTTINFSIIDDFAVETDTESIYIELDDITLSDTEDEETILLDSVIYRVFAYNITDDIKTFGFDAAPTDTLFVTSAGTVSTTASYSGTLINGTSISFTSNLPAGVSLNAPSATLGFTTSESTRTLEFNVAESAFTGTDAVGTYVISGINANGDNEAMISDTNNTIVIKIVNP